MKHVGLRRGSVRLLSYDKKWPQLYEAEKLELINALDGIILEIEHVGSTSVVGLAAKPLIDIIVSVNSLSDYKKAIKPLEALGYEHMPERVFSDRVFFPKGSRENRTFHLSLVEKNSKQWTETLLFRDYLRAHPQKRDEYARLKQELAQRFANDRKLYTEGKDAFIKSVLALAAK